MTARASPARRSVEAPGATVQSKKKKKHKKKKTPGVAACPVPAGASELVAPEQTPRVGRPRTRKETMCINWGCAGHFRSECEAPPRCPTTLAFLG